MGTITESFANLSDHLADQYKKSNSRSGQVNLILETLLRPMMPNALRIGTGTVTDIKDRQVGPFDLVASLDSMPPFGQGGATTYLADGIVFALQIRNWAENDLTQFGEMALQLKKLDKKTKSSALCFAISFDALPLTEMAQFLSAKSGMAVDGILCIGHHVMIRNSKGWYGDPVRVPFVTERPGPEALKAFTFFLLQLAQGALHQPFGLDGYQHL